MRKQSCLSLSAFVLTLAASLAFASNLQAQTPPGGGGGQSDNCPSELLFELAGMYYYGTANCNSGQAGSQIKFYSSEVQTGCSQTNCNCTTVAQGFVNQESEVGDPPSKGKNDKFKPMPLEVNILTPFGESKISRVGAPYFVKVDVMDEDRYFKVFTIKYREKTFRVATEVKEDPAPKGKSVKDGSFEGKYASGGLMIIKVDGKKIEAIHEK